jgi:hypothetical protein
MSSAVPSILSGWVRYRFRPGVKAYNFGQFGRIVDGLNGKLSLLGPPVFPPLPRSVLV